MKRRTVVILSLLSALFSLVYILSSYYGLNRYLALHIYPLESYTKNYTKLDKASPDRVVVSISTCSNRINKLEPVIKSLLDQTVKVDEIALTIPYSCKVPDKLSKVLTVYKYSVNYKDNGKLIPPLLREGEKSTKIIIVNDDMIYGKDFIEEMVEENKKENKAIVNKELGSKYGILVTPEFFDQKVCDYDGKSCYSRWLKKNLKSKQKIINYNQVYKSMF